MPKFKCDILSNFQTMSWFNNIHLILESTQCWKSIKKSHFLITLQPNSNETFEVIFKHFVVENEVWRSINCWSISHWGQSPSSSLLKTLSNSTNDDRRPEINLWEETEAVESILRQQKLFKSRGKKKTWKYWNSPRLFPICFSVSAHSFRNVTYL